MKLTKGNVTRAIKKAGFRMSEPAGSFSWTPGFRTEALSNGSVRVCWITAQWPAKPVPERSIYQCAEALAPLFPCVTLVRVEERLSIVIHAPKHPPRQEAIVQRVTKEDE